MARRRTPLVIAPPGDPLADAVCRELHDGGTGVCRVRSLSGVRVSAASEAGGDVILRDSAGTEVRPATIAWVLFRGVPTGDPQEPEADYLRDEWLASFMPLLTTPRYQVVNHPHRLSGLPRPTTSWGARAWLRHASGRARRQLPSACALTNTRRPARDESAYAYPDARPAGPEDIRLALAGQGLLSIHRPKVSELWYGIGVFGSIVASGSVATDGTTTPGPLPGGALRAVTSVMPTADPIALFWIAGHRTGDAWTLVDYDPFPSAGLLADRLVPTARLLVRALGP